jgi:hypothetical protein
VRHPTRDLRLSESLADKHLNTSRRSEECARPRGVDQGQLGKGGVGKRDRHGRQEERLDRRRQAVDALDLVRTRLIVQSAQPQHRKYKNPVHALRTILQEAARPNQTGLVDGSRRRYREMMSGVERCNKGRTMPSSRPSTSSGRV